MDFQELMNQSHIAMLRVIAVALDAAVDHPDLDVTERLYEKLLIEASKRMRSTNTPAYPEALERVLYVEKLKLQSLARGETQ